MTTFNQSMSSMPNNCTIKKHEQVIPTERPFEYGQQSIEHGQFSLRRQEPDVQAFLDEAYFKQEAKVDSKPDTEYERDMNTVKSLHRQLQNIQQKESQIAELKRTLKTEKKEKEDYIRKYLLATKQTTKLNDLLAHSESIRQN